METPESLPSRDDRVTYREHFEALLNALRGDREILRAYYDQKIEGGDTLLGARIDALSALIVQAENASQLAIDKSDASMEKRLDQMNAFRDQLREQASLFASRDLVEEKVTAIEKLVIAKAEANADRITRLELKNSSGLGWLAGAGATIALAIALVGLIIRYVVGK